MFLTAPFYKYGMYLFSSKYFLLFKFFKYLFYLLSFKQK